MGCPSRARKLIPWALGAALISAATPAWAQDLTISAQVDKTTVDVGTPITLTITLSGDLNGVRLPPVQLPEGLAIIGRSQASNFSVRGGAVERSTALIFAIMPQRAGTFHLGPFTVEGAKNKHQQPIRTEPIEITVKKSAVPPNLQAPEGGRFTL